MNSTNSRMTLLELYQSQKSQSANREDTRALLTQTHWFTVNAEFDPKTGESLPQALSAFLSRVGRPTTDVVIRDRLWRIAEHCRASVERLLRGLTVSPRREQASLPIRAVRELDVSSFIRLSNRPGRNIREKLAGKPYIQAVRRFQSFDLPENRLLKALATRLAELLELRRDCLSEQEDELLPKFESWLRSDEAGAIACWDNLPPNNTLLSHRDYRRIWDSWRWLQTIDDDITRDFSQLEARGATMRLWNQYAATWAAGGHLFAEMPVFFDYDRFEIRPWVPLAIRESPQTIIRDLGAEDFVEPVCVDLTDPHPCFSTTTESSQALPDTFLWQHWKSDGESVDIELFNSDAAYLHAAATSISSSDLFSSKDNNLEHIDRAARAFSSRLRAIFKNDKLIWLVPDFLNDFELGVTRRNLNARFPDAEPLPRSVAAVFEQVDYSTIDGPEFSVEVVDSAGSKSCKTRLLARRDPALQERLPETRGFYWERCPPVTEAGSVSESIEGTGYDLITVDEKGGWREPIRHAKPHFVNPSSFRNDIRIRRIELTQSPVAGGIRLYALQQRAGDIPLWRDRIPELSIKVMKDGRYQRFQLVSRDTTIKPICGLVSIPVEEDFTLPSGKPFYRFPLFQGENADEFGFSARLDSPAFPLKEGVVCKLKLTFEYGADEPYVLTFTPLDKSFAPVHVTWHQTIEENITNAPAPGFPPPVSWADLQRFPKRDTNAYSDLLEWVLTAIRKLDQRLYIRPRPITARETGELMGYWHEDKNGAHFTFVYCSRIAKDVFIHEAAFARGVSHEDFDAGAEVSFELHEKGGKYSGRNVAGRDYKELPRSTRLIDFDNDKVIQSEVFSIRKTLYFPVIQAWRDGRSIGNAECPSKFADAMRPEINYLASLLQDDGIPKRIKREIAFLLACMHKDSPDVCVRWIKDQVECGEISHWQAVGFALGDVSMRWQADVLARLVTNPTGTALRVFAYAIWREPHFVEKFTLTDLKSTLSGLNTMLSQIKPCPPARGDHDKWATRGWVRATAEPLELLLGLLRTRDSSDFEIRMLLQPHQQCTKELAKQVERVTNFVADVDEDPNVQHFSRVQINLQKTEGDRTPDLLYALRLYLTGDDGANAIHITSIEDSDEN